MKTGSELIAEERLRQIDEEGYSSKHDDVHDLGELARAGAFYALPQYLRSHKFLGLWPWDNYYFKPTPDNRIRELVKAGALIAAEIDRLQRKEEKGS